MTRLLLSIALGLGIALTANASVRTIFVTKETQRIAGADFTLAVEKHPDPSLDSLYVKLTLKKSGDLTQLDEVLVIVSNEHRLVLRVPVELKPGKDGELTGTFHINPDLAKKCIVRLSCPRKPLNVVTNFEVKLESYLAK